MDTKTLLSCNMIFTNWIDPGLSDEYKRNIGNHVAFTKISLHGEFHKVNSKTCRDLQWNHDASTPHRSDMNGAAERQRPHSERRNRHRTSAKRTTRRMVALCDGMLLILFATCMTEWPVARQQSRRDMAKSLTDHRFFLEHWLNTSKLPRWTKQE